MVPIAFQIIFRDEIYVNDVFLFLNFFLTSAFQIIFRAEIHVNDIFFILKILFLISIHQNDPKHIKYIKFFFKKIEF